MVHRYRQFSDNIVLDVNTNAVYVFDDPSYELLSAWSEDSGAFSRAREAEVAARYGEAETSEAKAEIESLIASGQLFSRGDPDAELEGVEKTHVFKSLCLHMAHDCNMRCAYCFASAGSFGMERGLMGAVTAKRAIDFVVGASGGRTNIEIDFFGGEPMLNFGVIKETVRYARDAGRKAGKRFRFTLTTNGTLLDDGAISYINENMDNLVLSIDGRREVNDAARKTVGGGGTYDLILPKFKSVLAGRGGKSYYMRGTYTALNTDFSSDVLHLADQGFDQISVEPVVAPGDAALALDRGHLPELEREYDKLALCMRRRAERGEGFNFFHFMVDMENGPCFARRIKGCGAGYEYAAVSPDGGIYPCHQFVGVGAYRLGDVFGGITNMGKVREFQAANIHAKPKCRACWAKYFCGGGCAANAYQHSGKIDEPDELYCALLKKRVECAIWLNYASGDPVS
jgi:uncharacterized protein